MKSSPMYLQTLSNALWNLLRIEMQCTNLCLISSSFCVTLLENQNICLVSSPPPLADPFQRRTKHLLLILQVPWCPVICKPEAKTLQLQGDLCQSFHRLVFCYLEARFIFILFSLRTILLDRENGGKIDTEICFFYVTGFKLQTCLDPVFFLWTYLTCLWYFLELFIQFYITVSSNFLLLWFSISLPFHVSLFIIMGLFLLKIINSNPLNMQILFCHPQV